jgi:hypothetical protein
MFSGPKIMGHENTYFRLIKGPFKIGFTVLKLHPLWMWHRAVTYRYTVLFKAFITTPKLILRPTHHPILLLSCLLSPGVNRPESESNHSPPASAEVDNFRTHSSFPSYVYIPWRLVKGRENFAFILASIIHILRGRNHLGNLHVGGDWICFGSWEE